MTGLLLLQPRDSILSTEGKRCSVQNGYTLEGDQNESFMPAK